MSTNVALIGYASGVAAGDSGTGDGPVVLQQNAAFLNSLNQNANLQFHWQAMLHPESGNVLTVVQKLCTELATQTQGLAHQKQLFAVLGGDHSCAVGTWSGVATTHASQGPIGLIWIDAHLDAHTPQSSESGNIHGMPVACLLGQGASELTTILSTQPKILPENICLIGIRSYEPGEVALIKKLGVRIFEMDEIKLRGISAVMQDALAHVKKNTVGFGLSVDLDGFDPSDAPAVGTPETEGISASEFCKVIKAFHLNKDAKFLGAEVVEFNPHHDENQKTQQLIQELLLSIF